MRLVSRLIAAAGMVAALTAPLALSTPAQAQRGGFHGGGFHGGFGGFHGGGFRGFHGGFHGGFHRGGGFFPGFGIGLGLGVLGSGAYWGYPYYAYPPAYPPPSPYPYPYYSYPPSYGPYGAAAGPQYASYTVMPPQERRTVVREVVRQPVVREVVREIYVQPRRHHHRVVVHKRFCNCGPNWQHHWQQPKPAAPEQSS